MLRTEDALAGFSGMEAGLVLVFGGGHQTAHLELVSGPLGGHYSRIKPLLVRFCPTSFPKREIPLKPKNDVDVVLL